MTATRVVLSPMPEDECLELLPEASLRVDADGVVVACNGLAETLLGSDTPVRASLLAGVSGFVQWLAGDDPEVFRGRLHARRPTGVPLTLALSARRVPGGAVCMVVEPD